jgi:Ca2+-binding EF-hand superfamily protein
MLAGTMPFIARSLKPEHWIRLHRRGADFSAVKTSPASKDLCKLMLTFSDEERPSMAQCLAHEWFRTEDRTLMTVPPQQFASLQNFCHEAALKRTLLLEIASRLPIAKCGHIVELFEAFDEDRDGTLTQEELRKVFKEAGITDKKLVQKIFKSLDVDNDGFLTFSEFAAGVLSVYGDLVEERLRVLFKEVDTDNDEMLSHEEATELLANAAMLLKRDAKSRSTSLLHEILTKGDTKIKYEDLVEKVLGVKSKLALPR